MEIETKRFLLRDFIESDRAAFLAYQADPRNLTFYNPNESNPFREASLQENRAARLFELFQTWADERPRLNYQLAIVQRQSPHALVGCGGLRTINNTTNEMELGIELAPTYWGSYAYAIETGVALLEFGFRELKLETISGSTVSANAKIARLAEWAGAEIVTICPGESWLSERGWSEVKWRMTRSQWEVRKRLNGSRLLTIYLNIKSSSD
ncbi:GNAT family N-acetyltransferase [Altericista sp. CCNU0014]|uniref:GNAT family N-acetyltransferase n=1 Tax=Altericista sp. CCNU0014 TaxID=3082949 RepID=UPI00384F2C50